MPVYRWVLPEDVAPVRRLVEAVVAGGIDAVTFTSAPAAAGLLTVADELGRRAALVAALRDAGARDRRRAGDRRPARRGRHPEPAARAGPPRRARPRGGGPAARARPAASLIETGYRLAR